MEGIDWSQLQALRQAYLEAKGFLPDYWQNEQLLEAYDLTLAARIGWKWEAVLAVLATRLNAQVLQAPRLVDWGCGTGMASRTLLGSGLARCETVHLYDRSARATQFAARRLREGFPPQKLKIELSLPRAEEAFGLVVSHVLSELPTPAQEELFQLCERALWVIWVEAGRPQESRLLSQIRDRLLPAKTILAPCPHGEGCGMLKEEQESNWCHFFAPVPQFVFRSAAWRSYSQQLGIDLRSLPVSFIIAVDSSLRLEVRAEEVEPVRIIGRSRHHKAYSRWVGCHKSGILAGDFFKRRSREIYKNLQDPGLDLTLPEAELRGEKGEFTDE